MLCYQNFNKWRIFVKSALMKKQVQMFVKKNGLNNFPLDLHYSVKSKNKCRENLAVSAVYYRLSSKSYFNCCNLAYSSKLVVKPIHYMIHRNKEIICNFRQTEAKKLM